jgi:hypothetical protein
MAYNRHVMTHSRLAGIVCCSLAVFACVGDPPIASTPPMDASVVRDANADTDGGFSDLPINLDPGCRAELGTRGNAVLAPLPISQWKRDGKPVATNCDFIPSVGLRCSLPPLMVESYATYQTSNVARPPGTQLVYTFDVRTEFMPEAKLSETTPIVLAQFAWGEVDQARVVIVPDPANSSFAQIVMATPGGLSSERASFDTMRAHRVRVTLNEKVATLTLDGSMPPIVLDVGTSKPGTFVFLAQLGPFFPAGSANGIRSTYHRFLAQSCGD